MDSGQCTVSSRMENQGQVDPGVMVRQIVISFLIVQVLDVGKEKKFNRARGPSAKMRLQDLILSF
jgi:hypothetical protein